ncbi:hypothetical protein DXD17_02335 [[Ruminococcus] lactaris]|uniref:Uncharacterized protein n=1 Tax=[Ruminococcus] lactaris TaxID=46228 RepID=A0A3E4LXL2_9FIRM|nr:hypothetical protein DXD17_02335 [[Ruminococcus] lactaris]
MMIGNSLRKSSIKCMLVFKKEPNSLMTEEIPHHLGFRFFLYFFSFYPFLTDLFQRSSCRKYSFPISLPDGSYE